MKKSNLLVLLALAFSVANGQFKSDAAGQSVVQSVVRPSAGINNFLGFLNPDNFLMRHNVSLSYMSFGGAGYSIASYTNSMFYKIADPLNVRFDVTLQGSPYAEYGDRSGLGGVFLSRAEMNYRPWENFLLRFEYNRLPMNYYGLNNIWYNPYASPFHRDGE